MGTITMTGRIGTAVPAGAYVPGSVRGGVRLRSLKAPVFVGLRGWEQQLPVMHRVVPPTATDNSTGVSVPGRRHRP